MDKIKYRDINNVRDEGFHFFLALKYIEYFYTKVMNARIRRDAKDTLIKYGRDWEYPWVLIKSDIVKGDTVLDCGAGFSPVPFVWSEYGAKVYAIDRDILISSKFVYFLKCFPKIFSDMIRLFKRKFISKKNENYIKTNNHKEKLINKIFNYYERTIGRTFKPDFWGPIPPQLLKKYNINYRIGDFTSLPFEDRKFDVVTCVSVLEHMPFEDQIKGLKEMARVVKNNGQLIITYDKHKEDLTSRFINESGMTINDLVYFKKPKEVYNQNEPDIIGISLIKK